MTWLNVEKIEKAITDGWVTKRKHPEADLYILNYSAQTQYEWHWDRDTTMICRGLIVDGDWNVVARPFKKFFTLDQLTTLRNKVHHLYGLKFKTMLDGHFKCYDKLDGSLGILYPLGDRMYIATRGSFESDMAIKGSQTLEDMGLHHKELWACKKTGEPWSCLTDDFTFLFEIIYPDNRIVVDYGGEEKLVLIDVLHKSGGHRSPAMFAAASTKFEAAKEYPHIQSVSDLENENDNHDGREGYVLVFEHNDFRVKWKFDEYKRLHRILTGLTENTILEWLKDGLNVDKELADVPDEFYQWGKKVAADLQGKFDAIYNDAKDTYHDVTKKDWTRKEIAIQLREYKYRGLVFAMMDKKDCNETIWRLIKESLKDGQQQDRISVFS